MSFITVFAASKTESRPIEMMIDSRSRRRDSKSVLRGQIGANQVAVVTTGIGPGAARSSAAILSDLSPDIVIITGLCGSLSPQINEGEVIIYSHCLTTDGRKEIQVSKELVLRLTSLLREAGITPVLARGLSSPAVAATPEVKKTLATTGAGVVDMESYELLDAAGILGIPAVVIRSVSDSVDRKLPDFSKAINERGSFIVGSLAAACLASPIRTLRLWVSTRRAIENLKAAQRILCETPFANDAFCLTSRVII